MSTKVYERLSDIKPGDKIRMKSWAKIQEVDNALRGHKWYKPFYGIGVRTVRKCAGQWCTVDKSNFPGLSPSLIIVGERYNWPPEFFHIKVLEMRR